MGQRRWLLRRFVTFKPNSIIRPPKWHFFENFRFSARFILRWNRFAQICVAFRLEMGQWERLQRRFLVFRPNSIVLPSKITLFRKFSFQRSCYVLQEFRFAQIFQLFDWNWVNEQDPVGGLSFFSQIVLFRPMRWLFSKIFVSVLILFCVGIQIRQICATFQLEMSQRARLQMRFIIF